MTSEEQQKKAMEFQLLNSQLEQYQQQLQNMEQQQQNLENLSASLEEMSNLKKGAEFMSPLSSGVLVKTKVEEPEKVLLAVGASVMVKKPIKEAQKGIEEQKKQITLMISQLKSETTSITNMVQSLQQELQ